jgi:calcineurin-like phosphoesterase family protein
MANNIFFTSDQHFGHGNIIKYCNRPFHSVDHMNEKMIANWNAVVQKYDSIYILGDFAWCDKEKTKAIVKRLNGIKEFIIGSHDKAVEQLVREGYLLSLGHQKTIIVQGEQFFREITLNHYSMRVWPKSHYNTWMLFGHSHGHLEVPGKSFDVGVDVWNYYPVSLKQVEEKMEKLSDNFNLVHKEE